MAHTDAKFAALLGQYRNAGRDPHYLGFFDCFNRQLYFEAHEILETLWLHTAGRKRSFYKGLIQLAGSFVHVQKGRKGPALALLKLARENLQPFTPSHEGLAVSTVLEIISAWDARLRNSSPENPSELLRASPPALALPRQASAPFSPASFPTE